MSDKKEFLYEEAKSIGEQIGIDFSQIDVEEFRIGLGVELEHGLRDKDTDFTHDDFQIIVKFAWVYLN
mgnify:CR=1 FL=1